MPLHRSTALDYAEFLLAEGATLAVPTHTNASLIDINQPAMRPEAATPEAVRGAARLMEIYEALGCTAMWSCAPYHEARTRPTVGTQIVGSESNAVSFFNSVLGARTNKYGDLLDVCAAIIGKVPLAGLHTDEGRLATHELRLELTDDELADPSLPHLLGIIMGRAVGTAVPVLTGLPSVEEDALKAIAAAAATSGAVEMFHAVGVTPEAPTFADATGGRPVDRVTVVDREALAEARTLLTTTDSEHIDRSASARRISRSTNSGPCGSARRAPGSRRRSSRRHHQPGDRPRARPARLACRTRRARCRGRPRHLHLLPAATLGRSRHGHDQLGEVGLLRAEACCRSMSFSVGSRPAPTLRSPDRLGVRRENHRTLAARRIDLGADPAP